MNPDNYFNKLYHNLTSKQRNRFVVIGGVGFVCNYIGLTIFYHILKIPIIVAQLLAAEVALLTTFVGNNYWSFKKDHHHTFINRLWRYHLTSFFGVFINSLLVVALVHYGHIYYGAALVVGSLVALIWNYFVYKNVVFKPKIPTDSSKGNA